MPITTNRISKSLTKKTVALEGLPREAYNFFKDITPKRSGNAKRKTRLANNTIKANYDYASNLDEGSSKKAPKGMSAPTTEHLNKLVRNTMRKK